MKLIFCCCGCYHYFSAYMFYVFLLCNKDKKCEVMMSQLSFSLISYLYNLVRKKEMSLLVSLVISLLFV